MSVLAAIFAFATLLRGLPPPQCPPPSKIFEGIWDPESRRRLATSLPGGEGKGRTAEEVAQFMDAYVAEWSSVYKTSCEATWRSGRQSERVFFVRMACLQGLAEELRIDVRAVEERGASPEGLMSRRRPSEACAASKVEEKIPPELGPRGE